MIPGFHPLCKTTLGKRIMVLKMDIWESEDPALLTVLLESEKDIIDQCRDQLPDLHEGLQELITESYQRLKEKENE